MKIRRLILVRRYLLGSLLAAILPLLLFAILYDRYSANLLNTLVSERIGGELKSVVLRMNGFIGTQIQRLEDLTDLPEIGQVFQYPPEASLPENLLDFLYFETGNPDIYGILFFDTSGKLVRAVPRQDVQNFKNSKRQLPVKDLNGVALIGPQFPVNGMPGWFLLEKPLYHSDKRVGSVALKIRLASLAEFTSTLYQRGIYKPVIMTADQSGISATGTYISPQSTLYQSRQFLPGWKLALMDDGLAVREPSNQIRYILLFLVAMSAAAVFWLYLHMSRRLALLIAPLIEGARTISAGDFTARVPVKVPGELGELARSFNDMSSQLQALIKSRVDVERRAALGSIAAGMAHEIRNPLATVKTSVQGLRKLESDPERGELLDVVLDEVERIDGFFEEFLGYARPRDPCKEAVYVKDVFKSVETLISASARKANVVFSMNGEISLTLDMDPLHLRQILMNLVLNSLQAMPDGGHISVRGYRNDSIGIIVISDTGSGIAAEDLDKIMMPFFTTRPKGTGLGLAICSQLTATNDGVLDIDSTPGYGTTVVLKLPIFNGEAHEANSNSNH